MSMHKNVDTEYGSNKKIIFDEKDKPEYERLKLEFKDLVK